MAKIVTAILQVGSSRKKEVQSLDQTKKKSPTLVNTESLFSALRR